MVSESICVDSNTHIDITCHDLELGRRDIYFYSAGRDVPALQLDRQVIVAIDPSKTNTAVVIGDLAGRVSTIYEISGAGSYRSNEDFCFLMCEFLGKVLADVKIAFFGQEKVILPKKGYTSMVYLNEIRTNLNNFSRSVLNVQPLEINVSAWKSAILPDGYRGRNEKGSHRWLRERYPIFYDISNDVTDAICIYLYIKYAFVSKVPVYCNNIETTDLTFSTTLIEESAISHGQIESFTFNPAFSIHDNAVYYANRKSTIGCALVPKNKINSHELYQHQCCLSMTTDTERIFLLVRRT